MSGFCIEPLASQHNRKGFTCGVSVLDRYLQDYARQDMRRHLAFCFVAVGENGDIAAFYTLAATSLALDGLPAGRIAQLPRYPSIPAILLGRLAVATACQGKGLGAALVADALLRARRSQITGHLMLVDAKDEAAARFYEHLGFERLPDDRSRLVRKV